MSELKDFTASVVLVGRFNPLIFSPEWLQQHNMIGPDEGARARESGIEVMAPNITSIVLGSMKMVVEETRFFLAVEDAPLVRAKDFSVGCFRLLSHTPITACGLNFSGTLRCPDAEQWHRFGDLLAPKEPWGDFVHDEEGRAGGMRAIVMERNKIGGDYPGYVRCSIQVAENAERAAEVQVNNHFNLTVRDVEGDGGKAQRLIEERWDDLLTRAKELFAHIKGVVDGA